MFQSFVFEQRPVVLNEYMSIAALYFEVLCTFIDRYVLHQVAVLLTVFFDGDPEQHTSNLLFKLAYGMDCFLLLEMIEQWLMTLYDFIALDETQQAEAAVHKPWRKPTTA